MKRSATGQSTKARSTSAEIGGLVNSYTLILEPQEDGGFRGRTMELPYVMGFGDDVAGCARDVRNSVKIALQAMVNEGATLPAPATQKKREEQINVKLTLHEKAFMMGAARRDGYRSIADFMRSLAMRQLR